jgi:hypothetical protein
VKERKNIFQANGAWKQAKGAISISDKADNFKPKLVKKKKRNSLHMDTRTTHQEAITIVNIYTPNAGTPNFLKQLDKRHKSQHNFKILFSPVDRSSI